MRLSRAVTRSQLKLAAALLLVLGTIASSSPNRADPATAEIATAQANAALIKSAYEAFSRGDTQSVFAVFAEDILWHVPGRGPLSRDYRGHAEVAGFFEHFMGLSEDTFQLKIDEILANRDRVVVLCTESASRAGRSWSSRQVHVWTVRDGRAIAFWEYEGDQQARMSSGPHILESSLRKATLRKAARNPAGGDFPLSVRVRVPTVRGRPYWGPPLLENGSYPGGVQGWDGPTSFNSS